MMKRAKDGEAEKVIVYSFSRFARSVTHLLSALQEFEDMGVKFISISESIDTDTPIGRALVYNFRFGGPIREGFGRKRVRVGLHNAKMKGIKIGMKTSPSN